MLSPEAWTLVALIAAACVFVCLGSIARALEFESRRQELRREVRRLRKQYALMSGHTSRHSGRRAA